MAETRIQKQEVVSPRIGEAYVLGEQFSQEEWWNFE
jgi:hypothetical protein